MVLALVALGTSATDSLTERRLQIGKMSPVEKQRLLDNHERFLALVPDERQRLRELDRAIAADENAEQLRDVMRRYHTWLMTSLSPIDRARLLQMEPEERITQIRQRMTAQARRREHQLGEADLETIVDWVERRMKRRLPPPMVNRLSHLDSNDQRLAVLSILLHQIEHPARGQVPPPGDLEFRELARSLSETVRKRLLTSPTVARKRLLTDWIRIAVNREVKRGDERFARFLVEEATPELRERLLNLPPDEMMQHLRVLYFREKLGGSMWLDRPQPLRSRDAAPRRGQRGGNRFPRTDRRPDARPQRTP